MKRRRRFGQSNIKTSAVDHLPDEIIELILSKCPAKSVLRFKSVSKSWQSILSDPRFTQHHRIQRSKLPENQNKLFVWRKRWGELHDYGLSLIRLEDATFRTKSESLLGIHPCSRKFFEPLCFCDGLFLFGTSNQEYMLWNPLIRKHIIIPAFNPMSHPRTFRNWINRYDPYMHPQICHLYHDSITDDYKILHLFELKCYVVFSFKNGSWGEINDFPSGWSVHSINQRAVVDGCLYGMWCQNQSSKILCFDVRDGKLHKLPQPKGFECLRLSQLEVVSGRLCLYGFSDYSRDKIRLWVMEENGSFDKYWRKLISMEKEEPYTRDIRPVYLTNKDDVVLRVKKSDYCTYKHFIYNPHGNRSFKEIDFIWEDSCKYFPYAENLDIPSSNTIC